MVFVLPTWHSFVIVWNCCSPMFCTFLIPSTADGSAVSLLSRTSRSSRSSSNGLFSYYIKLTSVQTSFLNAFCTIAVWSKWITSSHLPVSWCFFSKSSISAATSRLAIIHRRRAQGLSARPTTPPPLLMQALFCSCAWLMGIAEKTRLVFWIVKLPALNSLATSGCLVGSSVISRRCTEIKWAYVVWSKATNQGTSYVRASRYMLKEDCRWQSTKTSKHSSNYMTVAQYWNWEQLLSSFFEHHSANPIGASSVYVSRLL